MKLKELLRDLPVLQSTTDSDMEITGISYDSRATKPGDLFVAIRGYETDGHKYIGAALEKGAAAIVCEVVPEQSVPYILTEDTRLALAMISRAFFRDPAQEMTVIGLTGTNGKTTSSYLLKHLLEQKLNAKVGLIGTNGILIGDEPLPADHTTPESYELQKLFRRMADSGCSHVVMEVSSHSLVLQRVAGIRFTAGLFTNLTQDHLDFHGTMEAYAEAKRRLFSQCDCVCLNRDDPWFDFMLQGVECPYLSYSAEDDAAELFAKELELSASGVRFTAAFGDDTALTSLAIPGLFSVHNALGVMAIGLTLGISLGDCAQAISTAQGVRGRMESVPTDGDYQVIIDYSHTPDALDNALKTLKSVTRGRLIALFGCGGDRDKGKRPIMGAVAEQSADLCVVTSDNPRTEDPEAIIRDILAGMQQRPGTVEVICSREQAIQWAIDKARPGDVILLAGKGHEDYQVIGHEKRHMDERELVAAAIARKKT